MSYPGDGTRPVPTPDLSPESTPEFPFEIPRDLRWLTPRYEFVRELGRGMAVVYLARERDGVGGPGADEPARAVAVKVVAPPHAANRETAERFAREARTATSLNHPNIVRTLAIETSGDAVAIVTEYISGETLRAVLQARGALPFERAAAILRDVAAALAHAHEARLVHRDVKPENIFIETGTGHALLGDFGIARSIDADTLLTQDGASLGTPAYMAPEQVDGLAVDERTDVYALGLVGWEMLTGRRPWQGESLYSLLQKQRSETLPDLARLRPDVPLYLHRAIEGAIAKDPRARWHDAGEMLAELSPSPAPLPELVADASAANGGVDRLPPEVVGGETVRFQSGEIEALRPTDHPTSELTVTPAEYLRDEIAVAHLNARPPRRPRRRPWVAGLVGAAALAAAALAVTHRSSRPTSGDPQLDSLLALAAPKDSAPLTVPASAPPARAPNMRGPNAGTRKATAPVVSSPPVTAAPRDSEPRNSEPRDSTTGPVATAPPPAPDPDLVLAPTPRAVARDACRSTTNADQRRCLMALIYRNDAALNGRYQALIRELRRQAGGAAEPPAVRALRVEQRAWVDTRDRSCAQQVPLSRGPRWGVARAPCFSGFSTRRAAVLSARLRGRLQQAQ